MMSFYIFKYNVELAPSLAEIINTPTFLPMNEVSEHVHLEKGDYLILCCLYESN